MDKTAEQFREAVLKYKAIAIYIPGSPDPDAIASAYAIKLILKHLSIEAEIFAEKRLSLPQNRAFIEQLNIPASFGEEVNLNTYQAYIVPDFQNNRVEKIGDKIPCAVHIDHHEQSKEALKADFTLVRTDAGATSTLVALIVKNINIDFSDQELVSMATALTFGIQTDTDKYNSINYLDLEALDYLLDYTDLNVLQGISSMPLSPKTLLYYNKAKENEILHRDWAFYGIGYIDSKSRDSIAITADMILENSDHNTVAVFAVIENSYKGEMYLDVSLRSRSEGVDLNRIIKQITPNGGGRKYKGAYQINLNYFLNAPDKNKLWEVVQVTTVDKLSRSRDVLYISDIGNIYGSLKNRMLSFFKKDSDSS